jgi:hypothetical protein
MRHRQISRAGGPEVNILARYPDAVGVAVYSVCSSANLNHFPQLSSASVGVGKRTLGGIIHR